MESVSTIVVPVDLTEAAEPLLRSALNVARTYDATLHLLHVYQDVFSVLSMRTLDLKEESVEKVILKSIHDACDELMTTVKPDVPVIRALRKGDTADEILRYVSDVDADLIMIATNARSGFEQFFIGSIAQRIVRYAVCPVLTFHPFPDDD